jgi:hypothetical protein
MNDLCVRQDSDLQPSAQGMCGNRLVSVRFRRGEKEKVVSICTALHRKKQKAGCSGFQVPARLSRPYPEGIGVKLQKGQPCLWQKFSANPMRRQA